MQRLSPIPRLVIHTWSRVALCWCVLSSPLWASRAQAGKLDDTRDRTSHSSWDSDSDDDDSDDDDCNWLTLLFFGCSSDDDSEPESEAAVAAAARESRRQELQSQRAALRQTKFFLSYPYAGGRPGNLLRLRLPYAQLEPEGCGWSDADCRPEAEVVACIDADCYQERHGAETELPPVAKDLHSGRLQLFSDMGKDSEGLLRTTLGLWLGSNGWFGFDTRWTYWAEFLDDGTTDGLWMGDVNLHLQLINLPALQWSAGAGPRLLADADGKSAGANLTTKIELYPVMPLALRVEGDTGNLGSAWVWEVRSSAGVMLNRFEVYGGYDLLRVADIRFDSWVVGLRVHL